MIPVKQFVVVVVVVVVVVSSFSLCSLTLAMGRLIKFQEFDEKWTK